MTRLTDSRPFRTSLLLPGILSVTALAAVAGCQANTSSEPGSEAARASLCAPEDLVETGSAETRAVAQNGWQLNGAKLNGSSLNGVNFNGARFNGIRLNGAKLNGIDLNGMRLNGMRLNGINLQGTTLNGITLQGTTLNGINLQGTTLNGITLQGTTLNGIDLNGINLQGHWLNSPFLQGTTLNGIALNGINLQGTTLNGKDQNETSLDGVTIERAVLQGGAIVPVTSDGRTLAPEMLTSAVLVGELDDGSTIPVHLDAIVRHDAHSDVYRYRVTVGKDRLPLCGEDAGGAAVLATPLAGAWDHTTGARIDGADLLTFACEGAALAKCVHAGYKPWLSETHVDLHQACTRMVRADYCGDGRSFTKDGTEIDIFDELGIQSPETLTRERFAFEAAWGPDGATCVAKTRYPLPSIPSCLEGRLRDDCEAAPNAAMLRTRSATDNPCLR